MHQRLASVVDIDILERAGTIAVAAAGAGAGAGEAWPSHFTGELTTVATAASLTTSIDCGRRVDEHCQRH